MTEDLTAELHKLAGFYPNTYYGQLMGKAAREIERLEQMIGTSARVATGSLRSVMDLLTPEQRERLHADLQQIHEAGRGPGFIGNPPIPSICKTTAGNCGCHGNCPPKKEEE